jgi:flagellar protein FliO/FliZ
MTASPEWMDYLRVPLALLFVVGLIFLSSAALRKTGLDKRIIGNKGAARMSVVETLYLDPRRRLVIVREGENEHVLLLSAAGDLHVASRKGSVPDA